MADYSKLAEMLGDLDEDGVVDFLTDFVASDPSAEAGVEAVAACQTGMIRSENYLKRATILSETLFSPERSSRKPSIY
jgi:hypothetical protein